MMPAGEMKLIDGALLGKIENSWFNRKCEHYKVVEITEHATNGTVIPPLIVARIGPKLILIDGQHRCEARKEADFPLWCQIVPMTERQAINNFLTINSKASRVSLQHRLRVDPNKFSVWLRKLHEKYESRHINVVYNLVSGITYTWVGNEGRGVTEDHMKLAETILELWTNDKRWGDNSEIYDRPGTLRMVGRMCADKADKAEKIIRKLKGMDYRKESALADKYGASHGACNKMVNYATKTIFDLLV